MQVTIANLTCTWTTYLQVYMWYSLFMIWSSYPGLRSLFEMQLSTISEEGDGTKLPNYWGVRSLKSINIEVLWASRIRVSDQWLWSWRSEKIRGLFPPLWCKIWGRDSQQYRGLDQLAHPLFQVGSKSWPKTCNWWQQYIYHQRQKWTFATSLYEDNKLPATPFTTTMCNFVC